MEQIGTLHSPFQFFYSLIIHSFFFLSTDVMDTKKRMRITHAHAYHTVRRYYNNK